MLLPIAARLEGVPLQSPLSSSLSAPFRKQPRQSAAEYPGLCNGDGPEPNYAPVRIHPQDSDKRKAVNRQQACDGKPETPVRPSSSRLPHRDPKKQTGVGQKSDPTAFKPTVHFVSNTYPNRQREEKRKYRERGESQTDIEQQPSNNPAETSFPGLGIRDRQSCHRLHSSIIFTKSLNK
jgi:hypothetical protein